MHGHIKIKDKRTSVESWKDRDISPVAGVTPGHASCELKLDCATVMVEFSRSEIIQMLNAADPTYIPTMDAAYRFMVSNPKTSADMLAEIPSK